jgi:hypothetical protein
MYVVKLKLSQGNAGEFSPTRVLCAGYLTVEPWHDDLPSIILGSQTVSTFDYIPP